MKIGMLFPLSNAYPGIGQDFIDGLTALTSHDNTNITILKESVGFGAVEKDVCLKAEKLLISDDVDILIAFVDEKVLPILHPLVQATGKLMLVVNTGANYPVDWIPQPTIVHLTLQHGFLCWLTGKPAAQSGNGAGLMATTYYDCGYLHAAAMVKHFLQEGGSIRYNYVNNQAYDNNFEIDALTNFLSANPDCENLLCVFDQLPASLFYDRLSRPTINRQLKLFSSPMMLQQKALENNRDGFPFSIEGFIPWHPLLENKQNEAFLNSCKRPASIFSLLGWETGLVLTEIIKNNIAYSDGEKIISHLANFPLESPRGKLWLDKETQHYVGPALSFRLDAGEVLPTINIEPITENEWRAFAIPTEGAVTGWTNTYLCY